MSSIISKLVAYENGPTIDLWDRSIVNWVESEKFAHFSLPLRNAGAGIAFVRDSAFGWEGGEYRWHGQSSSATLAAGEIARFRFSMPRFGEGALDFEAPRMRSDFSVKVEYSDLAGNLWTTRADVRRDPLNGCGLSLVCS